MYNTDGGKERVLLVAVYRDEYEADSCLDELELLCKTAGGEVVARTLQRKEPISSTMVGSGKLKEIAELVENMEIDTVIFDNELSGVQIRNIANMVDAKILDRSNLILDIFAARARSMEGKLQVELAQLKYSLPRLIGAGGKMSKMRSGIGMRGPGETKLETDRRVIRRRVFELEERIKKLEGERDLRRRRRLSSEVGTVALVGYTNAGKSTILNALAREKTLAEDMLFATLDPVTRKVYADTGRYYVVTDTVGFIDKLPTHLIDAFSSTLEEARTADVLLHIMDISSTQLLKQHDVVMSVLNRLGADEKSIISVYNKVDKLDGQRDVLPKTAKCVEVSAKSGQDMDKLREMIESEIFGRQSI